LVTILRIKTIDMRRKEIKQRIDQLHDHRQQILHRDHKGKDAEYAALALSDIEHKIVVLEDMLDFETRMLPFKIMLYGFIVIACGLLVWAYIMSK
jgi:hypothetical protein